MKTISNERFGAERALYHSQELCLVHCAFDGDEDGESALKESSDIRVEDTLCNLRYPFWHDRRLQLVRCEMTEQCRAPLWYSESIELLETRIRGVKALRECSDVTMRACEVASTELGWSVRGFKMQDCDVKGEYCFLRAEDLELDRVCLTGKYSFQYIKNAVLSDCILDTKDAFWHADHVTLRNCIVKGEYLAWYSNDLTLIDCKISGTQPFCYCKQLKLVNCEMQEADLAFERSDVDAVVTTPLLSIKNPRSGRISAPAVGEVILDDAASACRIQIPAQGQLAE